MAVAKAKRLPIGCPTIADSQAPLASAYGWNSNTQEIRDAPSAATAASMAVTSAPHPQQ